MAIRSLPIDKCSISIYRVDEQSLEVCFLDLPENKAEQTVAKICYFFGIKSDWDKELISSLCSDRKYNHFELINGFVRYVVDLTGIYPFRLKGTQENRIESSLKSNKKSRLILSQY